MKYLPLIKQPEISEEHFSLIKRWANVGSAHECWPFIKKNKVYSFKKRLAYGQVTWEKKKYRAHRAVWKMAHGDIPVGMFVCHKCDNSLCINPNHLFLGTPLDNARDKIAKGRDRYAFGESHPHATLTDAQVRHLRERAAGGENQRLLAEEFHVSRALVSMIKNSKTRATA